MAEIVEPNLLSPLQFLESRIHNLRIKILTMTSKIYKVALRFSKRMKVKKLRMPHLQITLMREDQLRLINLKAFLKIKESPRLSKILPYVKMRPNLCLKILIQNYLIVNLRRKLLHIIKMDQKRR